VVEPEHGEPGRGRRELTTVATTAIVVGAGLLVLALAETVLPGEIPAVTVALAAGLVAGPFLRADPAATDRVVKAALPVAIVLIGLRVSADQVRSLGPETLALVVAALAVGLGVALAAARLLALPPRLGTLLALGTAICGNTAIVSAAPILRARRDEIAYAVATITVFGTAAALLFPPFGHALGLGDTRFGIWAGLGVNDTSQVVATGFAYSDHAGETATVVKLVRNAFLGPILVGVALLARDRAGRTGRLGPTLGIPWFVWGFAAASALASLDAVPGVVVSGSEDVSKALVLVVMVAVGLSTRLGAMRAAGLRPFVVGLVSMTCLSALVLAAVEAGIGS
jgi:uncharacterized integral membrane protein (TIGR00698 family)